MGRAALLFAVLVVVGGCASYHAVDLPWEEPAEGGDFAARSGVTFGDCVRVRSADGLAAEGVFVVWSARAVSVAEASEGGRLVEVPAAEVVGIEVLDRNAQRRLTNALLAIGTSFLVIEVVDDLNDDCRSDVD